MTSWLNDKGTTRPVVCNAWVSFALCGLCAFVYICLFGFCTVLLFVYLDVYVHVDFSVDTKHGLVITGTTTPHACMNSNVTILN